MKRKLKVAVIGAGHMATLVHYPSLSEMEDVTIQAVCDLDEDKRNTVGERYGIAHRYADYRQMLEREQVDAVYAIGPPHVMYDTWKWCLEHGHHLYIEKPLGITLHQARALVYLAEQNNCITQVGFQRRSSPMVTQLREACLQRGPIIHAVCRFYKSEMTPYLEARDRMMDDTVHSIDTLRWICGGEVTEIESHTKCIGVPDINYISATLHFDNGSSGYLINSWSSGRRLFSVEMHAPNICVEAEHEGQGRLYADGDTQGVVYDARTCANSDQLHRYGGFYDKHRAFIDAIQNGTQPSSNFADAYKTMEVAARILAQSLLRS